MQLDDSIEFVESVQVDDSNQFESIRSPHIIIVAAHTSSRYTLFGSAASDSFRATGLNRRTGPTRRNKLNHRINKKYIELGRGWEQV